MLDKNSAKLSEIDTDSNQNDTGTSSNAPSDRSDAEANISFDPPVFKQRYAAIQNVLIDERWRSSIKKVVDFGCAELKLFLFLKRLYDLRQYLAVDIEEENLKENMFRVQPLLADHLDQRPNKFNIKILVGSIGVPSCELLNTDAVVGIEIIEHLYPDTLEAVPHNIFGFIRPKIAVFTTPNADFNVLFPNFKGTRHYDHKFEWSREQFEEWALNIAERYPSYSVSFDGIGAGPNGTENLGCCSQLALFTLKNEAKDRSHIYSSMEEGGKEIVCSCQSLDCHKSFGICTYLSKSLEGESAIKVNLETYKEVGNIDYPFTNDNRTTEERILDDLIYMVNTFGHSNGRFFNDETNRSEIPIAFLVSNKHTRFVTLTEAECMLTTAKFKVEECATNNGTERCVIYEQDMEDQFSDSDADDYNSENLELHQSECEEEDWNSPETSRIPEEEENEDVASGFVCDIINGALNHDKSQENGKILDDVERNYEINLKESEPFRFDVPFGTNSRNKENFAMENEKDANVFKDFKSDSEKDEGYSSFSSNAKKRKAKNVIEDVQRSKQTKKIETKLQNCSSYDQETAIKNQAYFDLQNIIEDALPQHANNVEYELNGATEDQSEEVVQEAEHRKAVECASCEVLFDENSQPDLDFNDTDFESQSTVPSNDEVLSVGNDNSSQNHIEEIENEQFPDWLLFLLNAETVEDFYLHHEPHFYCQGDGIGIHPSSIEVEGDDVSSISNVTNTDTSEENNESSDNNTVTESTSASETDIVYLSQDSIENVLRCNGVCRGNDHQNFAQGVDSESLSSDNVSVEEFFDALQYSSTDLNENIIDKEPKED